MGIFSNVPDAFSGFVVGFCAFCLLSLAVLGIIMLMLNKKDGERKSVGCGTPLIIILIISIAIGVVGAYYNGTPLEEVQKREEYRKKSYGNEKHACAICGSTEDTRQINNNKIGGKWDENWYCTKHYASAWQYYYGNNK